MIQMAGTPPVSARQKTICRPSGDWLARKSQTGGAGFVRAGYERIPGVRPANFVSPPSQARGQIWFPEPRRKMISHTPAIGTQAEAIRKTILGPSELARLGAVQIHAEDLADLVANNLHQHPLIINKKLRRAKWSQAV